MWHWNIYKNKRELPDWGANIQSMINNVKLDLHNYFKSRAKNSNCIILKTTLSNTNSFYVNS